MGVRVVHDIDDLANDLVAISRKVRPDMRDATLSSARDGNRIAKEFARKSAGAHGRHYYKAFTAEQGKTHEFGGVGIVSAEYGPQIDRKQGEMSFERGSRNQPPHNDLARSAALIAPWFDLAIQEKIAGWFW